MNKIIFVIVFIFLIKVSYANVIINEIMADPIDDEDLNEWLEIYNNGSIAVNVSGWLIGGDNDNKSIEGGLYNGEGTIIPSNGFAIITDDETRVYNNFNVSDGAIRLYLNGSTITENGLKNDGGDTIYLYDNNKNLIDKVTYNSTTEDLSWAFVNGSFFLSSPTSGFNNNGSILAEGGCDFQVEFILASDVFENSSAFNFKVRASKVKGTTTNVTAKASIKDLFGTLIREYSPFTNESVTRQQTSSEFTPNLDEGKSYEMNANITTQCTDSSPDNNFDTRIITIKGAPLPKESSLSIESIQDLGTDKKAKFGQIIRVRANVYKGDTAKNSVVLWIEDNKGGRLSKESRISMPEKFTSNSFTVPIQIKPNCNNEFDDDEYTIRIEGLDAEDEEEIEVEGIDTTICREIKVEAKAKTTSSKSFNYEIIEMPESINAGEKFEVIVRLDNNQDVGIPIKIWSYVYRGSKSYSGDREENKKEFLLKARISDIVELSNIVPAAEDGDYKLKVVINKDSQKTNNEITEDIKITNKKTGLKNKSDANKNGNLEKNKITQNAIKNAVSYESSTEKAKELILISLMVLSVILNVILIWRR